MASGWRTRRGGRGGSSAITYRPSVQKLSIGTCFIYLGAVTLLTAHLPTGSRTRTSHGFTDLCIRQQNLSPRRSRAPRKSDSISSMRLARSPSSNTGPLPSSSRGQSTTQLLSAAPLSRPLRWTLGPPRLAERVVRGPTSRKADPTRTSRARDPLQVIMAVRRDQLAYLKAMITITTRFRQEPCHPVIVTA